MAWCTSNMFQHIIFVLGKLLNLNLFHTHNKPALKKKTFFVPHTSREKNDFLRKKKPWFNMDKQKIKFAKQTEVRFADFLLLKLRQCTSQYHS